MKAQIGVFTCAFDNDNQALIPEVWATEALMLLWENTVILPTVHRDFENLVARQGELVHAHKPAKFESERKVDGDDITIQDATATDVQVKMDFHSHTSFMIYDGERSKAFKDLIELYLSPAVESIAQEIDEILAAQKYQFMDNMVGQLGTALTAQTLIDIGLKFNLNNVPQMGRWFMQSPTMTADLQAVKLFTDASQVGDDGTALREGSVGIKYGINNVMSQNMAQVPLPSSAQTIEVNNLGGYPAGTATLTVDGSLSAALVAGQWLTIAGDARPRQIVSSTGGTTPTEIVITPAIETAVLNDADIVVYDTAKIGEASSYPAGWTKRFTTTAYGSAPTKGQMVSFAGSGGQVAALIGGKNTTTSLKIDQSFDTGYTFNVTDVNTGPSGDYGMAYTKNAIAFVSRPLVLPENAQGVQSAVMDYKGLAIRVTMSYDARKQGTIVTLDLLHGVKVIDKDQGILVLR